MNSPVVAQSLLQATLDLAAAGLPVLPAYPDRKYPRITGWPELATTDAATIRGWFTMWPDSRISLATGRQAGFVVLDIDPEHGGDEALETLELHYGELPPTLEVWTGSGGRHKYFRHPGLDVRTCTGLGGLRGVDVRGEGGQVIAPPSLHENGTAYCWELSTTPSLGVMASLPSEWV